MKFKLFARLKKKADDAGKGEEVSFDNPTVSNNEESSGKEREYTAEIVDSNESNADLEMEIEEGLENGLSETELIKKLRGNRYTFSQIDKAMANVMNSSMASSSQSQAPVDRNFLDNPDPLLSEPASMENYRNSKSPLDNMGNADTSYGGEGLNIEEVEEIVNEMLYAKLNELYEFKEKTNKALVENSKKTNEFLSANEEMKKNFDLFKKNNEKEIADLKDKMSNMLPRILSIEKAFKEVVPNIVDEQRAIKAEFDERHKHKTREV